MEVTLISIENSPSLIFPVMQEILIKAGHKCKYIFTPLQGSSDEYIKNLAEQIASISKNSKLIGFSCMTNTFPASISLIKSLKKYTNAKIVVGGVHPTLKPFDFTEYVDYVCVGEGEEALLELANKISQDKKTDNIENIYVKKGDKLIVNPLRPIPDNLSSLPTPEFNFKETYMERDGKIVSLDQNKNLIKNFYNKYYYIITSRGCPYRCKYCLNGALIKIHKGYIKIRRRSNEHVLEELRKIKKILPKETILGFVDDDFCAQPLENLREFCLKYKKEIGMPFLCASTPSSMNEEKLKCLIDAGLIRLEIGVQTINDNINKEVFGRFATKKQVVDLSKILDKYRYKLEVCYDFILDNPWETDETRLETLRFMLSLNRPFTAFLFSLTTYPGTDLYERAKKEGILKKDSTLYKKNHMLLNNNKINTLIILYNKFNFPKKVIKFLILIRNIWPINIILENSSYFIWRMYNYFYGLRDSIRRKDKEKRDYYLYAPIKSILKKINKSI